MRRSLLVATVALWPALAAAQIAFIAPTAPNGDNGDRIANTAWVQNFVGVGGLPALPSGQIWIGSVGNVATGQTLSGDATVSVGGAIALAAVNANTGPFGSATQCVTVTNNAKGLTTAVSAATCTPVIGSITGLGTGVATALGVNVGTSGSPVINGGALGTPSSGTLTNVTGLPLSAITGLGTGVSTALAINTGSAGAFVVNGGALGTPSSGTLTSATGLPVSTGVSGLGTGVATMLGSAATGSGGPVGATSPSISGLTATGTTTATGLIDASGASAGQIKFPSTQNASANVNTLDDYKEGTFTPTISFGGASVGVTYSVQTGQYTKIGNVVFYAVTVILTSKGSSVGGAAISGLPVAASAAIDAVQAIQVNNMAAGAITAIQAQISASTSSITPTRYAAGTNTAMADTDFTNTSVIKIAGHYFTN